MRTARRYRLLHVSAALALTGVTAGVVLASGSPGPTSPAGPAAGVPVSGSFGGGSVEMPSGVPRTGAARPASEYLVVARGVASGPAPKAGPALATARPAAARAADFVAAGVPGLLLRNGSRAAWAPDGSRYAVVEKGAVVSRRADGLAPVVVASGVTPTGLAWSPDGLRIAVTTRVKGVGALLVTSPSKGAPTRVALAGGRHPLSVLDVSWLSDSTVVAVATQRGRPARLVRITVAGRTRVADLPLTGADAPPARAALLDPTVSPDRSLLVYREVTPGAPQRLLVVPAAGGAPRVLARAAALGRPVWSADGSTVYAADPGRRSAVLVSREVATGAVRALAMVAGAPVVHRRPVAGAARVERVAGRLGDLVQSLLAGSRYAWAAGAGRCTEGHAQGAVLVPAGAPAKALAATPLAARVCGPVLATRGSALDAGVSAELRRVLDPRGTGPVYLVGTVAELPAGVERAVRALRRPVVRIAARDVQATALAIAVRLRATRALLVSPDDLATAAAAAAPAHDAGAAVLFTRRTGVDRAVLTWLSKNRVQAWAVGARAQRAAGWAARLGGADAVGSALDIARNFYYPTYWPLVASTSDPAGAAAAAAVGASIGVPVLLTTPGPLSPALRAYLDACSASVQGAAVLSPTRVVPAASLNLVRALTGGSIPLPTPPAPPPTGTPSPTATPTPTTTPTPTDTPTSTDVPTPTPTSTPASPSPTASVGPSPTSGPDVSPSPATTPGATPSPTGSP